MLAADNNRGGRRELKRQPRSGSLSSSATSLLNNVSVSSPEVPERSSNGEDDETCFVDGTDRLGT